MRKQLRKLYRWVRPEPIPPCDAETLAVLQHVLRPDSNTVDVGCNRGSILREMVRLSPSGRHFAFEPIPRLQRLLRARFPEIECHGVALSDRKGVARFNHFVELDGFSGLMQRQDVSEDTGGLRKIEVQTERLDDVLPPGVRIALIKIDVEGAEFEVLRGAEATLRTSRPTIIFECGKGGLDLFGHTSEEMFTFLEECDFTIKYLDDWSPHQTPLDSQAFAENFKARGKFMFVASPAVPSTV